ncbi:hypothetical protein LWI29_009671 [Acer saccharum]|uniref:Uncharacterized protein n=1 Tax=Acer saccharum TaxID=4024 RepID=A0AA39RVM1_ACESA|nr:hypothetical protein LWI29_009671 [Acer saccharum]
MDKMDKRSIGRKDDKVGIEYLSKPKYDSALNGKLILKKSNTVRNTGEIGDNRSSSSDLDGSSDSKLKSLEREPKSFEAEGEDGSDRPCRGDGLLKDFVSVPSSSQTQALDSPMHSSVGQLVSDPDEGDVGEVGNDRSMKRIGRKRIQPVKSHGMITRLSKARALDLNHDIVKEDIVPMVKKSSWNLRDEIA